MSVAGKKGHGFGEWRMKIKKGAPGATCSPGALLLFGKGGKTGGEMNAVPTLKQVPTLFALRAEKLAAGADGKALPDRVRVLKWGRNETTKGLFILDDYSAKVLPLNQTVLGFDTVALDYEHNTVPGTPAYLESKEPRPIAANGRITVVPGEGLFIESLNWTPSGTENARNYPDLSGAVARDEQNRVIFAHSVALTRNGATPDIHLLSVGAMEINDSNNPMDPENMISVAEMAGALGIASNPTKAGVLERLKTLAAGEAAIATLSAALKDKDGKAIDLVTLAADVKAMKDGQVTAASAATEAERQRIVADAAAAGKIIPLSADTVKTLTPAALREMVDGLKPGMVALSATASGKEEKAKTSAEIWAGK